MPSAVPARQSSELPRRGQISLLPAAVPHSAYNMAPRFTEALEPLLEALRFERLVFAGMSGGGKDIIAYAGRFAHDMSGAVFLAHGSPAPASAVESRCRPVGISVRHGSTEPNAYATKCTSRRSGPNSARSTRSDATAAVTTASAKA